MNSESHPTLDSRPLSLSPAPPDPSSVAPLPRADTRHFQLPLNRRLSQPSTSPFLHPEPSPWHEPVDASLLLHQLAEVLKRFVVLPGWAPETLALWILHTYAFHLRDVSTYLGIESPEKRCGKTTLLSVLNKLAHRALAASNISPPAFFRVIEDLSPTLLIDEVDTFLSGNDQLRGVLNAGYNRNTAFVLRAAPSSPFNGDADTENETTSQTAVVKRYSCWCPKVLARIGSFPDTLADRCIIIRMQRKTSREQCERSNQLDPVPLKQQCLRFVEDHAAEIASARPQVPASLNDRAADIWEPLLALADIAGGQWPELARQAAVALSAGAEEQNPIGSFFVDILLLFTHFRADRLFSRILVDGLNSFTNRPWNQWTRAKQINELWLAQRLRPYGIHTRTIRVQDEKAKGYLRDDFKDSFRRYISRSDLDFVTEPEPVETPGSTP